ncbi:MAG: hypothetical protein IH984_06825 [Planctomycetes bacterium]|nr:hypothetical protein [Planctomycetota bacterium]
MSNSPPLAPGFAGQMAHNCTTTFNHLAPGEHISDLLILFANWGPCK